MEKSLVKIWKNFQSFKLTDRIVQSQFWLLHQHLRQRPSRAATERRNQQQNKSEQIELSGFVSEKEKSATDHDDDKEKRPALEGKKN